MTEKNSISGKVGVARSLATGDNLFDLWILIAQVRQIMLKARRNELFRYHISPRKASVLIVIDSIEPVATPAAISKVLSLERHSVSEFLSRMEADGLLKKTNDLERKNLVRISLTPKGRQQLEVVTKNRESIHTIMSSLSENEQRRLKKYLLTLAEATMKELGTYEDLPFPA